MHYLILYKDGITQVRALKLKLALSHKVDFPLVAGLCSAQWLLVLTNQRGLNDNEREGKL